MDLDDLLAEYWPALLGAAVLFVATIFLWPTGEDELPAEPEVTQLRDSGRSRESVSELRGEETERTLPAASEAAEGQPAVGTNPAEPTFQIIEKIVAVPGEESPQVPARQYETDDPEVRSALKKVEVTLYESDDCAVCDRAREYLSHNQITFTRHSVDEDPNMKEKMRRLSGGTAVPVIVIDGQVLRGFSEASVQGALTAAVKARISPQAR